MPFATPYPTTSPIADATIPSTRPSTTTERMTCRRDAPRVRSVASSRVRWATVIDRVLKITNAPTSSAMPPKTSRMVRILETSSFQSPSASLTDASVPLTCRSAVMSGWMARTSCAPDVPGLASIDMMSKRPSRWNSAWADLTSQTATLGRGGRFSERYDTVPATLNV